MTADEFVLAFGLYLTHAGVEHFSARELCDVGRTKRNPDTGELAVLEVPPAELWPNILPTARVAMDLRASTGSRLRCNSGFRNEAYNLAWGSKARTHRLFQAMDLDPLDCSVEELHARALEHPQAQFMGIGVYPSFVHLDTRGHAARWDMR